MTYGKMRKSRMLLGSVLALAALWRLGVATPYFTQVSKDDLFAEVPTPMKEQFSQRLNLMIEVMRAQKYEEMYTLLSEHYTQSESKEAFVARLKRTYSNGDKIFNFTPEVIGSDAEAGKAPRNFFVIGCIELHDGGHKRRVNGSVRVFVENDGLYFSELGPDRTLDGKYIPCSKKQPRKTH